jgi:hypothetical protein
MPKKDEHGVLNIPGYNTHINIGASIRGTAVLARGTLHLTNITNLPSGRAMAADYKGIRLINVYAPSGTARRADREQFYTSELPCLFHDGRTDRLFGVISTSYYTAVTPRAISTKQGPHGDDPRITTAQCSETEPRPTYIHIPLPACSHDTRPFLHNLGTTAKIKWEKKLFLPPSRTTTLSRCA